MTTKLEAQLAAALAVCRRVIQNDWHNKPRLGMEHAAECADDALAAYEEAKLRSRIGKYKQSPTVEDMVRLQEHFKNGGKE